ncbi:MAG TPA: hypothetical protein VED41_05575 [Solirubrobacteraceae bacterium]|nr:hypothetical protein [Solirubrobacteraceae bacterium]
MRTADLLPDPPPSLDDKRAGELAAQTEAVLARQRRELEAAITEALEQVPAPLRGVVRRALGM